MPLRDEYLLEIRAWRREMQLSIKEDLASGDQKIQMMALDQIIFMMKDGENIEGLINPIMMLDACRVALQCTENFHRCSLTLDFLSKVKDPELLAPLIPTICAFLEDRDSFLRLCALEAVNTIYIDFDFLIPDAPELIDRFLDWEHDMGVKMNTFLILINSSLSLSQREHHQNRALSFLSTCKDQVYLQLEIVKFIKRVCHQKHFQRPLLIPLIYNLLNSDSTSVRYEAAGTLVTLSDDLDAIKTAISTYIVILVEESDSNWKLNVLDRLEAMRDSPASEKILAEQVIDILRALNNADLEVRRKALSLSMGLVTQRNIEEMVLILKEEIQKTSGSNEEDQYQKLLFSTLQYTCTKYPDQFSLDVTKNDEDFNPLEFVERMKSEMQNELKVLEKRAIKKERFKNITAKIRLKLKKKKEIIAELKEKNATLEQKIQCKICLNKDIDMVFLPCCHLACSSCGHRVSHCHVCREFIQRKERIFLP